MSYVLDAVVNRGFLLAECGDLHLTAKSLSRSNLLSTCHVQN